MSQFSDPNPYASPSGAYTPGGPNRRQEAQAKMNLPAIFLMILAPVGMVGFGVDLFGRSLGGVKDSPFVDPNNRDMVRAAEIGNKVGAVVDVVGIIGQIVVFAGAFQMRALQSRSLAMTAAVISCVPCLSACCVLGIPFGVWALVAMNDPLVREAFR